jgi:Lhr-like helicase
MDQLECTECGEVQQVKMYQPYPGSPKVALCEKHRPGGPPVKVWPAPPAPIFTQLHKRYQEALSFVKSLGYTDEAANKIIAEWGVDGVVAAKDARPVAVQNARAGADVAAKA